MRSIGAVFSESSAAQYVISLASPECFDAMLFVERTTAARNIEYGWLGIQFEMEKLIVDVVLSDSPAAKAGIKKGDVILKIDATTFARLDDFVGYIRSKKPGEIVTLLVKRRDQDIEINVTLGKRPVG